MIYMVHVAPTWVTVYVPREQLGFVKTVIRNERVAYQLLGDSDGEVISILPVPNRSYQKLKSGNLELPIGRGQKFPSGAARMLLYFNRSTTGR